MEDGQKFIASYDFSAISEKLANGWTDNAIEFVNKEIDNIICEHELPLKITKDFTKVLFDIFGTTGVVLDIHNTEAFNVNKNPYLGPAYLKWHVKILRKQNV